MKILLSILCGIIVLFVGGCVMSLGGGGGPIIWASWAIVIANLLLIAAMWGMPGPMRALFIAMAVLDVAVALLLGGVVLAESGSDPGLLFWGLLIAVAFLVKAGFSYKMSRRE